MIISKHRWCILYMRERRFLAEVGETEKSFPIFGKTYIALVRCRYFVSLFANVFRKRENSTKKPSGWGAVLLYLDCSWFSQESVEFQIIVYPGECTEPRRNKYCFKHFHFNGNQDDPLNQINDGFDQGCFVDGSKNKSATKLNKYLKDCSGIVMRPINGLRHCIANIASHWMVDTLFCSFFSWIFKYIRSLQLLIGLSESFKQMWQPI